MLMDLGVSKRDTMQILGHRSEFMNVRYDHELIKHLVEITKDLKVDVR